MHYKAVVIVKTDNPMLFDGSVPSEPAPSSADAFLVQFGINAPNIIAAATLAHQSALDQVPQIENSSQNTGNVKEIEIAEFDPKDWPDDVDWAQRDRTVEGVCIKSPLIYFSDEDDQMDAQKPWWKFW